jgi:uncharacterized protein (DUF1501 family)
MMTASSVSRRDFLKFSGGAGVLGASKALFPGWMPRLAFGPPEKAFPGDALVCIFLRGGLDGLSAVPPYMEGADYYDARPTTAVSEPGRGDSAGLDLDGQFGLHPALLPLMDIYDDQRLAIVHATGSIDPTRSHFDAMQFMEYGTPGEKRIGTGWLGRHLQSAAWQNESPFRAIGMGAMVPAVLRGPIAPLSLKSIADFHFKGRENEMARLRQSLSQLYTMEAPAEALNTQANLVFETIDLLNTLNIDNYQPGGGASYSGDEFGLGLQQIAQLIKADVGLEVACIDLGGWDTHENQGTNGGQLASLLNNLARGLAAFYHDLGTLNGVNVVVMSEFGRRVQENGSWGTDHGHGNVMLLLGEGVLGGQVYSKWPGLGASALDEGDLAITTDYRDVLAELVSTRLLNPELDHVFPGHQVQPIGLTRSQS